MFDATFWHGVIGAIVGTFTAEVTLYGARRAITWYSLIRFGPEVAGKVEDIVEQAQKGKWDEVVQTVTGRPFDEVAQSWGEYLTDSLTRLRDERDEDLEPEPRRRSSKGVLARGTDLNHRFNQFEVQDAQEFKRGNP
jgi:hypothetical protein